MPEHVEDHIETVRVRRAPKISVFLLAGAALGVVVAMILTFTFDGSTEISPNTGLVYSQGQVFGFLILVCVPIGLVVAAVAALAFDRRSRRRAREVVVDHESVQFDNASDELGRD